MRTLVAKCVFYLGLASISSAGEVVVAHGNGNVAVQFNQPLPPLIAKPPSSAIPSACFTALAPTKYDMAWLASGRNWTSLAFVGLKSTLP
eukprot:Skav216427  [mRNA]  locus=scaffold3139:276663:277331:+ [translate_table: standard]